MNDIDLVIRAAQLVERFDVNKPDRYEGIFDLLGEVLSYRDAAIFLLDDRKRKIALEASRGKPVDLIRIVEFEMGSGFSAWVAKERRIVLLNELQGRQAGELRSFLSVPLLLGEDLVGVVNFGHDLPNAFTTQQAERVQVVASLLAGILTKQILIGRLRRQNEKIQRVNRELNDTREKLVAAEKQAVISATVVSLNHEINNPLQIISGNLQMAMQMCQSDDVRAKLQVAEQQILRIADVLKKLRSIEQPLFSQYIEGDDEQMIKVEE